MSEDTSIIDNRKNINKPKKKEKVKKERIWEVDFLRSIPIILVMLYHLCYYFYDIPPSIFSNYEELKSVYPSYMSFIDFCQGMFTNKIIVDFLQPFFSGVFLFVCGVSCSLTRSNLRRSILLWIVALALSGITYGVSAIAGINCFIAFGVIHVMAFSITFYWLLEIIFKYVFKKQRVPAILCLVIGILILSFGILAKEFLLWEEPIKIKRPSGNNVNIAKVYSDALLSNIHLVALGIKSGGADYFPIFPNTGIIFIGIAIGKALYGKNKKSIVPNWNLKIFKPFNFLGRHTLWFYFLSTPVFIAIIIIAMLFMGYKIDFSTLL